MRHPAAAALYLTVTLLLAGCGSSQPADIGPDIARIRAVDNHAHPVRVTGPGEEDREFDALPVDNMEPASDPVYLRPGAPGLAEAARMLFPSRAKQPAIQDKGDGYPAWVLDRMGVEVMLANRVQMGRGIQPPRFRWVPYA
ncbi:MAG TPA: hypothetical protein VKR61_20710, partial [Bryobacteraceae bacterium]|nr:hypothetical protein [Bryobacteraceae bacterium]